jgi:hypothetical protein
VLGKFRTGRNLFLLGVTILSREEILREESVLRERGTESRRMIDELFDEEGEWLGGRGGRGCERIGCTLQRRWRSLK